MPPLPVCRELNVCKCILLTKQVNIVSWLGVSYFCDHAEINLHTNCFSTAVACCVHDGGGGGGGGSRACNFKVSLSLDVASIYVHVCWDIREALNYYLLLISGVCEYKTWKSKLVIDWTVGNLETEADTLVMERILYFFQQPYGKVRERIRYFISL